jgi:VanZ family protein
MGLLLPCSVDDVQAAYRDRAKVAHPDAGGSASEFTQLQADYEAAMEYARFHASRRGWLAANVERYTVQQAVIAEIERRGGSVQTERRPAWITREIGDDFAQLLEVITAVRLTGPAVSLADVEYLVGQGEALANLHRLDLSDAYVDYRAIKLLAALPTLHELNLSGTLAGNRAAATLAKFPSLRQVNVADTFIGWLARLELRRRNPDLEVIRRRDEAGRAPLAKRRYRWLFRALLVYVAILIVATHMPEEPDFVEDLALPGMDKLIHVAIYCGLSFLLAFLLSCRSADRRARGALSAAHYVAIALFVASFAAFDEFTQPWTGRRRDLLDWLADLIGLAVGLLLFTAYQAYTRKRTSPAPCQL